ncbi:M60 family metallopeptidase [Spiroplasma sp. hyd1]|uniref:M60 family metallopeptidase n=1 Tax=Spiroplasma sp. hyd1 TaxID=1609976 RepID=UPI0018DB8093|nr:M60 family metallopeptidase [Spiroplasma sp. hyd1]MBH8622814.1 hypothetical protein [Spiroplasma sp. hyd1]
MNPNYSGIAKKHQQYIHIANPDTGAGYASATNYHITFQNDTSAGADLFTSTSNNQWGLWHEIGHTYQTPQYQWNGLTEVTVNISALYVQQKLFNANRLDTPSQITKIKDHFAQSDQQRNFDDISDLFTKLAMFWQLQMAFGNNFYPTLSQYYRLLPFSDNPGTNVEKQQLFIEMTSQVSNCNLAPFFYKVRFNTNRSN